MGQTPFRIGSERIAILLGAGTAKRIKFQVSKKRRNRISAAAR